MSNIEQSLSLLIPTLSNRLPAELTTLSNSLLAQSRHHAGNLKPEEEIARPYACSQIACKRLGTKLRLPAVREGRPPCAPRVYKKLLAFLERTLPLANAPAKPITGQDTPTRRGKNGVGVDSPRQAGSTPSKLTWAPQQSHSFGSPSRGASTTPRKRKAGFAGKVLESRHGPADEPENDDGAPVWAMPLIRRLCRSFSVPLLPPHVYTGLCVVLKLAEDHLPLHHHGDEDKGALSNKKMEMTMTKKKKRKKATISLTTALFFMVLSRMQRGKLSSAGYLANCKRACAVANDHLDSDTDSAAAESAESAAHTSTTTTITKDDIDSWIKTIALQGWAMGQEWWDTVPDNTFDPPPPLTTAAATAASADQITNPPTEDDEAEAAAAKEEEEEEHTITITTNKPKPRNRSSSSSLTTSLSNKAPDHDPDDDDEEYHHHHLLPGLATMMQDSVDWLSHDRRTDYHHWLINIEKKLDRVSATATAKAGGKKRKVALGKAESTRRASGGVGG